jgi:hypothetical protein
MNSTLIRSHTISKRLEIISRRFVFIIVSFILVYSQGSAADNIFTDSSYKQFTTVYPQTHYRDSTELDSMIIDDDSIITENDSTAPLPQHIKDTTLSNGVDSTDEADTLEPKWSVNVGVNYKNQQQKNGVDLSGGKPVIGSSIDISHEVGLGLSFNSAHRIENGGAKFQNRSLGINYTYSAAPWVDLSLDYTHYTYSSDTINALAAQTGSISLSVDFYIKKLMLDISIDRYLGATDKQTYFTLAGLMPLHYKNITISPLASISLVSYQIQSKRIKKAGQATTKRALSLSSIMASISCSYPLFFGISATFSPAFIYSPLEDLSSKRTQVNAEAAVTYTVDF